MGLLGLKCILKSIGVAWLYYVEGQQTGLRDYMASKVDCYTRQL